MEEESMKVGVGREEEHCRSRWIAGVNQIEAGLR